MPDPPKKAAQPLQLFRPPKRNVHDLLDVDVLDDDTRRMLMNDIWNAPPAVLDDVPRTTTTTTTTSAATSTSPGPNKDSFPDHLRKEVHRSTNTNKSTNNTSNSDGTLMAAMASRLASVEKKLSAYQHELREMHEKHRAANNNLQKERTLREDAENVVLTLYEERKEMEEDLRLLHHALSDKGFQWRDSKLWEVEPGTTPPPPRAATPTSSHGSGYDVMKGDYDATTPRETPPTSARPRMTAPTTTTTAAASSSTSAPIDVDKLMYNARILSDHVGWKGIVSDGRRGALQDRDVVRVVVYSNGICINNGPFRPYGWPLCEAFIDDLLDGFYPYEYKERYPDGFPIEVTDQRHVPCAAGAPSTSGDAATRTTQQQSEKNGGQRLGGRIVDTQRDVMRNDGGYREMSKEEFLQRLPKQMISPNGHMCEVRETVANLCGVVLPNNNNKKSAPVKLPAASASASASAARALEEGEVEVHVRLPSGQVATLRMHVDRTVADLRKLLMTKMEPTSSIARGDFELCQAYPPQSYNEHTATLREAGIIRSCTLMLRNGATTSAPTSVATEVPQLPPPPPPSSSSVATGQSFKLRPRRKPGTS